MHPKGIKRMGANPNANGGLLLKELIVPDYKNYAIDVPYPGAVCGEDMRNLGKFVRDIIAENKNVVNTITPALINCHFNLSLLSKKIISNK